jgi:hypothetical protein
MLAGHLTLQPWALATRYRWQGHGKVVHEV